VCAPVREKEAGLRRKAIQTVSTPDTRRCDDDLQPNPRRLSSSIRTVALFAIALLPHDPLPNPIVLQTCWYLSSTPSTPPTLPTTHLLRAATAGP
jgi:hypothetical protein